MWGYGLDQDVSRKGQVEGTCECGNGTSGSIKCEECFDQLQKPVRFSRRTLIYGVST
jgi:hypothetical protein